MFADLHRELLAVKPLDMQEALAEAAAQGPEALEATQEECEAVLMQVWRFLWGDLWQAGKGLAAPPPAPLVEQATQHGMYTIAMQVRPT